MIDLIVFGILLFSIATFVTVILVLRSSQRSVQIGESRYELLIHQNNTIEMLREERQALKEELQRGSQEQQLQREHFHEPREGSSKDPERQHPLNNGSVQGSERQEWGQEYSEHEYNELREEWERERQANLKAQQRIEQLEKDDEERLRIQQDKEQLSQERQQLISDLEREREERRKIQQEAERSQQERVRLQEEYQLLRKELDGLRQLPTDHSADQPQAHPRWSRPVQLAAVLFGILALWFTSLMVALYVLQT